MRRLYILFVILSVLSGCKSTDVDTKGMSTSLLGVVYDKKNNPVQNAKITIYYYKGKEIEENETEVQNTEMEYRESAIANTDVDGRFYIPELEFGKYYVKAESSNTIVTDAEFEHFSIDNVLIVRVPTYNDVVEDIEDSLKILDREIIDKSITTLDDAEYDDPYYIFLKSIYYLKTDRVNKSEELLLGISQLSLSYVDLLLADIYQYHKNNNEKAVIHLKRYLNREYNNEINNRLKELENAIKTDN